MSMLRFRRTTTLLAVTLVAGIPTAGWAAEDPAQIIKKTEDLYLKAKSFQAVLQAVQAGKDAQGKMGSIVSTQKIAVQAPNRFSMEETVQGTGSATEASKRGGQIMKCDGKTLVVYAAAKKQYAKQPAPPAFSIMQIIGRFLPNTQNFTPKLVGEESQSGKSVFHIQMQAMVPKEAPAGLPPEQKKAFLENLKKAKPVDVYIEKGTYQLVSVKAQNPNITINVAFLEQSLNRPVTASLFAFVPPAGATEFKPTASGGVPPRKP